MHRLAFIIFFTLPTAFAFSQVQRIPSKSKQQDSIKKDIREPISTQKDKLNRKELIRELDLTKEQMIKLKELKEANQEKLEKINADSLLNESQRKQKIRQFRKEQMQLIQSVLTDEQKQQYKQLMSEKIKEKKQDN